MKKINYFYVDESGGIENDSNIFIMGCIKTDTPVLLSDELLKLKEEINKDLYFYGIKDDFNKQGFHAVENHPDVRTKLYARLPFLNYRSYFVLLNKKEAYFSQLSINSSSDTIYKKCLSNLLRDRLLKCKHDKNILIFEELTLKNTTLKKAIEEFLLEFKGFDIEYQITSKSELNLSLVDYLNYILYLIFNDTAKKQPRMEQNFELVKPRIGLIKYLNKSAYFSRYKKYNLKDIVTIFGG